MTDLRKAILDWSGSWSASFPSKSLDTYEAELGYFPFESVKKALAKSRADWEHNSVPTLKHVLERVAEMGGPKMILSTMEFNPRRGLELDGPAWEDPAKLESNRKSIQDWADGEARWGRWHNLSHPQLAGLFARFGVTMPVKPEPRQGVFSEVAT